MVHRHGVEIQELQLESGREYTFGRGDSCDVQLAECTGISRLHFRLIEENGMWIAQVVSKFGDISHNGLPVRHLPLDVGTAFEIVPYYFSFLEQERQEQIESQGSSSLLPVAVGQSSVIGFPNQSNTPQAVEIQDDFDGNDEATNIVTFTPESPYLRIVEPNRGAETIKLEGRRWMAGREDSAGILLNDRKASRRQFELTSTPQGYFIRDLGSANGTQLNGMALAPDELKAIRSGDVIQVGALMLHFEIRDPNFNNKLMVVQSNLPGENGIIVQNPYEMINYPVAQGPGGAVRLDNDGSPLALGGNSARARQKKIRFWGIVALVMVPVLLVLVISENKPPSTKGPKVNVAFEKLSPKQQQQVKEMYLLASNLYMQNKLALAASQFQKIHGIIPDGYQNSLAMANECAQQAELERQLRDLEEQKRRAEEIRRTVEKAIHDCDSLSRRSYSEEDITRCLRPALDLDPENQSVGEQLARVRQRIQQREIDLKNQTIRRALVAKGRALYEKALTLEQGGEYIDALDAYRRHTESSYPDPDSLKQLSRKQIFAITKQISSRVEGMIKAAEAAYAQQNYKDAFDNILKAKKMDPRNIQVQEINGKFRRELNIKLREMYEESIISEGLGQIPDAQKKWKAIKETDSPDGDYHRKASNKLRLYGQ
jgi:pSer/pThr/pTyr-binding forkhead associated (FHA) protein/tetratricopeptide (TPR) repeat protein